MALTPEQFETVFAQCVVVTPGGQLAVARVLIALLQKFGERFGSDPLAFPPLGDEQFPRIVLASVDGQYQADIAPGHASFSWRKRTENLNIDEFIHFGHEFLNAYLDAAPSFAGRMALVTHRFVQQNDPATVLSKHFCKDWVDVDQYSDTFEINFHRKLLLYSNLAVNTWFRCKSGDRELEAFDAPPQKVPGILLETDINTLSEMKDSAVFNPSEQLVFFRAAVVQSDSLVRAYFSERKSG